MNADCNSRKLPGLSPAGIRPRRHEWTGWSRQSVWAAVWPPERNDARNSYVCVMLCLTDLPSHHPRFHSDFDLRHRMCRRLSAQLRRWPSRRSKEDDHRWRVNHGNWDDYPWIILYRRPIPSWTHRHWVRQRNQQQYSADIPKW